MRFINLLIAITLLALVKSQADKEPLELSSLSSGEALSLIDETDEKWKTTKAPTTTTTFAPKKKHRSKKKNHKKIEAISTTIEVPQSPTPSIVTLAPTPGFETDPVTDLENMLNLKEIKFETTYNPNPSSSSKPTTTTVASTTTSIKVKTKKSKKHSKKENKKTTAEQKPNESEVPEAEETEEREKRDVNNNEKIEYEEGIRKLETSLNGPIERIKVSKSIQVPHETRLKRAAKKESTTKNPLVKNAEETAPPDQGAQVVAELPIEDEDALRELLVKKKIITGEIPEDLAHSEPKKHIGGNVRGGVVSFEEALQVTIPYDAESE